MAVAVTISPSYTVVVFMAMPRVSGRPLDRHLLVQEQGEIASCHAPGRGIGDGDLADRIEVPHGRAGRQAEELKAKS